MSPECLLWPFVQPLMLIEITTYGFVAEPVLWQTSTFCPAVPCADADACEDAWEETCVVAWTFACAFAWVELELEWLTLAWPDTELFCFVWPGALADLPCEVEPALAVALAVTLAFALAFAAGCAGCPGCFWCPGALAELPGDAGGPCPLPAIAVPASVARASTKLNAKAALRRFMFASPLLRTKCLCGGARRSETGLSPLDTRSNQDLRSASQL